MTPIDVHAEGNQTAPLPKLLDGLNDKPSLGDGIFVALQYICAIFIPIVTPGLI